MLMAQVTSKQKAAGHYSRGRWAFGRANRLLAKLCLGGTLASLLLIHAKSAASVLPFEIGLGGDAFVVNESVARNRVASGPNGNPWRTNRRNDDGRWFARETQRAPSEGPFDRRLAFQSPPIATIATAAKPPRKRKPAPRPKGPQQSAYAKIAEQITQPYRLASASKGGSPSTALLADMEKSAKDPAIRKAASHIMDLNRDSADRLEVAKRRRDAQIRSANATIAAAGRGEYTYERTYEYTYSDGSTHTRKVLVDQNEFVLLAARAKLAAAKRTSDLVLQVDNEDQRRDLMHQARAVAWDELLPALPDKFSGPVSKSSLVEIRFIPQKRPTNVPYTGRSRGYSERLQGKYVAKNVAGKQLSHVTLAVDFYHFSTMPEVTARHVYYVPKWAAGTDLELSRVLMPDSTRGGDRYRVPATGHVNDPPHDELDGMGGVLKVDLAVWSNEAKQKKTTVTIKERVDTVAPILLDVAKKTLTNSQFLFSSVRETDPKSVRSGESLEERLASRHKMLNFLMAPYLVPLISALPKSSPHSRTARHYLVDPEGAQKLLLNQHQSALVAACAEGKKYVGSWFGRAVGPTEIGLLFVFADDDRGRVRAELFNPRQPDQRRALGGYLTADPRNREKTLVLAALAPTSNYKPPTPAGVDQILADSVQTYRFTLKDDQLIGVASRLSHESSWYDPSLMSLRLKSARSSKRELADAKARDRKAPREQPRPPQPGRVAGASRPRRGSPAAARGTRSGARAASASSGRRGAARPNGRDDTPGSEDAFRVFKDATGRFSVKARFTSYGNGRVTLEKEDGTRLKLLLSKLSKEDQEWLKAEIIRRR